MRIAQIVKAKKLSRGNSVLVFDAEGHPVWNRVLRIDEAGGWGAGRELAVTLEGVKDPQDIDPNTRVVVWK